MIPTRNVNITGDTNLTLPPQVALRVAWACLSGWTRWALRGFRRGERIRFTIQVRS